MMASMRPGMHKIVNFAADHVMTIILTIIMFYRQDDDDNYEKKGNDQKREENPQNIFDANVDDKTRSMIVMITQKRVK